MSNQPKETFLYKTKILPPVEQYDTIEILQMNKKTMVELIQYLTEEVSDTGSAILVLRSKENKFFVMKVKEDV